MIFLYQFIFSYNILNVLVFHKIRNFFAWERNFSNSSFIVVSWMLQIFCRRKCITYLLYVLHSGIWKIPDPYIIIEKWNFDGNCKATFISLCANAIFMSRSYWLRYKNWKKKKETKFPLQIYRITITKHGSYFSSNCKD